MLTLLGNRYQVVGEIGAGGMGRVFQAVDTKTGKAVAAKVMIADRDENLELLLRFQQEGAVLSTLRHPNIVTVLGTFLEEDSCSIIMELLEGAPLSTLLRLQRLSLERVAGLGSQAASALHFAHTRGVIHRDVKPSNIMVVGQDVVKVTDFGIARLAQGSTLRTSTGTSLGTPMYMSPEQIEGGTIDARSDIYSLGAVLFEMVAGRPPFEGHDPLSVAFKHVHTAPPRPRELNADVPPAWESLILQMLEKDPGRRIQSAADVAATLSGDHSADPGAGTTRPPAVITPARSHERDTTDSVPERTAITPPEPGSPAATILTPPPSRNQIADGAALGRSVPVDRRSSRSVLLLAGGAVALIAVVAAAYFLVHALSGTGTALPTARPTAAPTVAPRPSGALVHTFGPFGDPEGVTVDSRGNIYLTAWTENSILKLFPNGRVAQRWGGKGTGHVQFNGPTGIAVGGNGDIFVSDSGNNRIQELSSNGDWRATWGGTSSGSGRGQFSGVHGIAVDAAGEVVAADYGNNRVVKLSSAGAVVMTAGGPAAGTGASKFDQPLAVAVDRSGAIYVADFNNRRVVKLSPEGKFVRAFATFGKVPGSPRPHGVAVDGNGNIYIADYQNSVVEEIGPDGRPIHVFGAPGAGTGQLQRPGAVFVDSNGNVFVADSGNRRVQEYAPAR